MPWVVIEFGNWQEIGVIGAHDGGCSVIEPKRDSAFEDERTAEITTSRHVHGAASALVRRVDGVLQGGGILRNAVAFGSKGERVVSISKRLSEPYSTLVLFLAVTGLRIGEAIAIKWSDFDGDVLHICRRVYEGEVGSTKTKGSNRHLPIPESLLYRMKKLGNDGWVFRSREDTPVNPGNVLKRYVRPVAERLGIPLGGWHDLRHTLTTGLLKDRVSAKIVSDILGNSDVKITLDTHCHTEVEDFREPLREVAAQLLPDVMKSEFQGQSCID